MISELKQLILDAGIDYITKYEERYFFNGVNVPELELEQGYILIEEFTQGNIVRDKFFTDTMRAQVYFFKIPSQETINDTTAEEREAVRKQIKDQAVYKLVKQLRTDASNQTKNFNVLYPLPRFSCQEIGVLLEFDFKESICDQSFS